MKTTKIQIKNLYGIKECELDGRSVEFQGTNGVGKSSVIEAIRLGLSNDSNKDYVIKNGEEEGEIIIETDSSLVIDRKKRLGKSDYKSIKENDRPVQNPESFLHNIFTPLQLDPIAFTKMPRQEQNRQILNLIEFDWDLDWIKKQFGEIPQGVDYDQHILKVLDDIQSERGVYFQTRQDLNRSIRNKEAEKANLVKEIPENYNVEFWRNYDFTGKHKQLAEQQDKNGKIERAKVFEKGYNDKLKTFELQRNQDIEFEKKLVEDEKANLQSRIEKLKSEIELTEQKLATVDNGLEDKIARINAEFDSNKAKLDKDNAIAADWANKEVVDTTELENEVETAGEMIKYINTYDRMAQYTEEIDKMQEAVTDYTNKIEIARELPSEILKTAKIPVKGLTVKDGVPLIDRGNGPLPVCNLSEGEQLDLCVDITINRPGNLKIILIDGVEKLSKENRERLYKKCKDAGLQFIATRTTDSPDMEVIYL